MKIGIIGLPQTGKKRELQIGLVVRVSLERDRLIWTGRIENREKDKGVEVTDLWLPWIYGIGNMGMGQGADVLYWPGRGGRRSAGHPRARGRPTPSTVAHWRSWWAGPNPRPPGRRPAHRHSGRCHRPRCGPNARGSRWEIRWSAYSASPSSGCLTSLICLPGQGLSALKYGAT